MQVLEATYIEISQDSFVAYPVHLQLLLPTIIDLVKVAAGALLVYTFSLQLFA